MSLNERTQTELGKNRTLSAVDLLADDILGVDVLRAVAVPTPEYKFGSQAFVAELAPRNAINLKLAGRPIRRLRLSPKITLDSGLLCRVLLVRCAARIVVQVDEEVVSAANKIRKRNAKATSRLFNTISRINGLTKADIDALEGNSEATRQENAAGSGESHSD